jgi:hypothetical protein
VEYLCRANPEFLQNGLCFFEFGRRALTFQREQLSIRPEQRQRPAGQPFEGCHGTRRDHIDRVLTDDLLGTRPPYGDVGQLEKVDALLQKDGTPQQRLQQRDGQIRTQDRQHDAGQSRARADVDQVSVGRNELRQHRTVENMPVPEALDLTRADQTALDTWTGQELGVPLGDGKRVAEDVMGRRWCGK